MMRVYASDYGIASNSSADQTDKINAAIQDAASKGATLVFENGVYNVSGQVTLQDKMRLEAAEPGGAAFRSWDPDNAAEFTNGYSSGPTLTEGSISGFIFDDIQIDLFARTQSFEITNNAFVNTTAGSQIHIGKGEFVITDNVFLSGPNQDWDESSSLTNPGSGTQGAINVAINVGGVHNSVIADNMFGGLNDATGDLSLSSDGVKALLPKVTAYDPAIDLYQSGYYTSLVNGGGAFNMSVLRNTFVGEEDYEGSLRDHNFYIRSFDGLTVQENYFTGWPHDNGRSANGGVKIRNGENLDFSNNILDNISLLTYADYHEKSSYNFFRDVYIYDNVITTDSPYAPIFYREGQHGTFIENVQIFDNVVTNRGNEGDYDIHISPWTNPDFENNHISDVAVFGNRRADGSEASIRRFDGVPLELEGGIERSGTESAERVNGSSQDDNLLGLGGSDTLDGRGGSDTLDGGNGHDLLMATGGGNDMRGGSGNDTIDAAGAHGTDRIDGGTGDDIIYGGYGSDTVDGGQGIDTYSQARRGTAVEVEVDLNAGRAQVGSSVQSIRNIENVIGAGRDDVLTGSNGANHLLGLSGNDELNGLGGNDTLEGGSGNDTLDGGAGNDVLISGNGNNVLRGGDGDDLIDASGSHYTDTIEGGSGNDTILGSYGNDTVDGGAGIDTYSQGARGEAAEVRVDLAAGTATVGNSTQTIRNIENVVGANRADVLRGTDGDNLLVGAGGNDRLEGRGGNDTLDGGAGNDILVAGRGNNVLNGGDGHDRIDASGSYYTDEINGGWGNDLILGSYGNDTVDGGRGNDTYSQASRGSATTVEIDLAAGRAQVGNSTQVLRNIENAIGAGRDDVLTGNNGGNVLEGLAGDDILTGGGGNDVFVFNLGHGNDRITDFTLGADRVELGAGLAGRAVSFLDTTDGALAGFAGTGESILFEGFTSAELTEEAIFG